MVSKSDFFSSIESSSHSRLLPRVREYKRDIAETGTVLVLILSATWTHHGGANLAVTIAASACIIVFAVLGRFSAREMGLTRPLTGAGYILLAGALACAAIAAAGTAFRAAGAPYEVPLQRSWQYAIWALEQQFILQSIFFVRLESVLGSTGGVLAAAGLFALVHIPNPVLTLLAFLGGILFCELFRRWRNLYPLGIIHAALGLTIPASFPDKWLHHMRVGIGYLLFH